MNLRKLTTISAVVLFAIAVNLNPAQAQSSAGQQCFILEQQLGSELWGALANPENSDKVREFAQTLVGDALPTNLIITIKVGDRVYDIQSFLHDGELSVKGDVMLARARKAEAYLGQDEASYLLTNQGEIPALLRNRLVFVFPGWRHPNLPENVAAIHWAIDHWVQNWLALDYVDVLRGRGRFLSRRL